MTRRRTIAALAGFVAGLMLLSLTGLAGGTYEHARATGKRCATCHTSVRPDAGNLNETGRFFLVNRRLPPAGEAMNTAPPPGQEDGAAIYRRTCSACHGPGGKGTPLAPALVGELVHGDSAGRLRDVVRKGVPGTTMAAFEGILSGDQIDLVVDHVLDIRKHPSRP